GAPRSPQLARLLGDLAAEIEWAQARLLPPSGYAAAAAEAGRRPPLPASEVAALYGAYRDEKARRGLVDFDDLLVACAEAIETDPAFAAGQRWRFRHLFVDEYQDVNPAQDRLLGAWLGDRSDLCVVGDPRQAIYGWNGADPSALTRLPRRYPEAVVVHLEDNWRSSPQVLAVAGAVVAGSLHSHRPDGPVPTVSAYESDRAEAVGIARDLRRAHAPGRAWSHLAVLTRTNAQLVLLEEALGAARIPYRVGGDGGFLRRPFVQETLAWLRRRPGRPMRSAVADLEEALGEEARGGERGAVGEEGEDRQDALRSLVRLAAEHAALDQGATVDGFTAWLAATLGPERAGEARDAVELATFHRAKGLEWPVVFLAGLEQGLVPIGSASTPAAEAEERRLLYVAITRAEVELHCSWAERRTFGTRTLRRDRSPYLEAIEEVCASLARGESGADVAALLARAAGAASSAGTALAGSRSGRPDIRTSSRVAGGPALALARGADPELIEALRSWRSAAARASGVPAYVILHDATLAAVAAAAPASAEELVALPGLGPVKAARYGPALLDVLGRHRASA
ncbi:MAG: ATP-dependent DNA helicase UvrD2, partial [Acidimicrobiales bacterium]